jgi:hypothetical protein
MTDPDRLAPLRGLVDTFRQEGCRDRAAKKTADAPIWRSIFNHRADAWEQAADQLADVLASLQREDEQEAKA